ncbi:MAG: hypothetical protein HFE74_00650 [Firmicutes bacterium]|jgi:hypothetical protein|nr:hypothetical protein [Bacillota bacterium]
MYKFGINDMCSIFPREYPKISSRRDIMERKEEKSYACPGEDKGYEFEEVGKNN